MRKVVQEDRGNNRQVDTVRWVPFYNATSETIPGYAVLRITGTTTGDTGRTVLEVQKPDTEASRIYAVNGHSSIPAGHYGACTLDAPMMALVDPSGTTPAVSENFGAVPGQWYLSKNCSAPGFVCLGGHNQEKSIALFHQWPHAFKPPVKLVACNSAFPTQYIWNDLSAYEDSIFDVEGRCYRVSCLTPAELANVMGLEAKYVPTTRIRGPYPECDDCRACWKLTDCAGGESPTVRYTNSDLSRYDGMVVKESGSDTCWEVERADTCLEAEPFEVYDYYETCTPCGYCYTLEGCLDDSDEIVVANDLARIANETIGEDSALTGDDLVTAASVFEIDGKCYTVTAYENDCTGSVEKTIARYFETCTYCGCFKLTECGDPENVIYVRSANLGSDAVSLRDILAGDEDADPPVDPQTVTRLDDGKCYLIEETTECDGEGEEAPQDVVCLEFYVDCTGCKVYTLTACSDGTTVTKTYSDLAGYGFSVGDIIQLDDDTCHTITDDAATFSGSVEVTPKAGSEPFPSCETCQAEIKYNLELACQEEGECDELGMGEVFEDIVTTTDLHDAVGKYVRYKGMAFLVSITSDPVTHETIEYEGPFESCEELLASPVSTSFSVIDEEEDRILKLKFVNGLLISVCPGETASEPCP